MKEPAAPHRPPNQPPGGDSGKITSIFDAISGEAVVYQYDALNRLISASGSGWTQTQAYDGFGNLTGRTGTGTAQSTTISTPTSATTNRLSGYTYDANGNLISTGYTYDVENRISFANAGGVQYFYDARNKRVWQATCLPGSCTPGGTWILNTATVNLFGADGKQLASYGPQPAWNNNTTNQVVIKFSPSAVRSYFGGKLVGQQLGTNIYEPVIQDRLGSVGKYYPYGEERNSPQLPNDQVKFATYTRDSATGNDYADQRYYTSTLGRFMTPDPYNASVGPGDPGSWNRYAHTRGDPINRQDPSGLDDCGSEDGTPCPEPIPFPGGCILYPDGTYVCPPGPGAGEKQRGPTTGNNRPGRIPDSVMEAEKNKAIQKAIDILKNNKDCAADFGLTGPNGNSSPDPITVLLQISNSITYNYVYSPPGTVTSARTDGLGPLTSIPLPNPPDTFIQVYSFVDIVLNDTAGSFVTGTANDQVVTILHELGHAYWDLFGQGTSAILPDGTSTTQSEANTAKIKKDCGL